MSREAVSFEAYFQWTLLNVHIPTPPFTVSVNFDTVKIQVNGSLQMEGGGEQTGVTGEKPSHDYGGVSLESRLTLTPYFRGTK